MRVDFDQALDRTLDCMIIWSKTLKSKQCHCKKSAYMTLWWSHDVIMCQTWSLSVNSVIILNFKLQSTSDLKWVRNLECRADDVLCASSRLDNLWEITMVDIWWVGHRSSSREIELSHEKGRRKVWKSGGWGNSRPLKGLRFACNPGEMEEICPLAPWFRQSSWAALIHHPRTPRGHS